MITYLYKKTHNITGLKYLGKTIAKDPHRYEGSGKHWQYHIKKHGYDVTTEILRECSSLEELVEWGLYYSNLWNVVESKEWANLRLEDGGYGPVPVEIKKKISEALSGRSLSNETRQKMSKSKKGKAKPALTNEHKQKLSEAKVGKKRAPFSDETKRKMSEAWKSRRPVSEETRKKISNARRGRPSNNAGKTHSAETKKKISESLRNRAN